MDCKSKNCTNACTNDLNAILANLCDFQGIDKATFREILNVSHMKEYQKGTILCYENDIVENVHYLFHGFVKVYKINKFDNEVIMNLYANNCAKEGRTPLINYQALINNYSFNNIICLEPCRILSINAQAFREIIKTDKILALNMIGRANKVIEEQEYTINIGMIYDARAKLASLLSKNSAIFDMLNKKVISQMLNISQETLSRNIQKLKDENIIALDKNKNIVVLDNEKLQRMFKG